MFLSKTKRNGNLNQIAKQVKLNPAMGEVCYDDKDRTIGETIRKRKDQISNPLLASLVTKNSTTMAFSSNAPRFAEKVAGEETYIGPGYYEQPSCFDNKSRSTLGTNVKSAQVIHAAAAPTTTPHLSIARSAQQIATTTKAP